MAETFDNEWKFIYVIDHNEAEIMQKTLHAIV